MYSSFFSGYYNYDAAVFAKRLEKGYEALSSVFSFYFGVNPFLLAVVLLKNWSVVIRSLILIFGLLSP